MKFLGEVYRSTSSELLVMVIRFKSGAAWPGSSVAPRFTENTVDVIISPKFGPAKRSIIYSSPFYYYLHDAMEKYSTSSSALSRFKIQRIQPHF